MSWLVDARVELVVTGTSSIDEKVLTEGLTP